MVSPFLIVSYVVLSVIVALVGRNTMVGFAGCFVLGLLLTPFVMAFVLMVAMPRARS